MLTQYWGGKLFQQFKPYQYCFLIDKKVVYIIKWWVILDLFQKVAPS